MLKITTEEKKPDSELVSHLEYLRDFCKKHDYEVELNACKTCEIKNSCFKHVETFTTSGSGALEDFCENAISEIKNENFDKNELERELSFDKAFQKLIEGKKLSREGWGKGYIFLANFNGNINTLHIVEHLGDDYFAVWCISQADILACDWFVLNE